jgi:hypothetical protein
MEFMTVLVCVASARYIGRQQYSISGSGSFANSHLANAVSVSFVYYN